MMRKIQFIDRVRYLGLIFYIFGYSFLFLLSKFINIENSQSSFTYILSILIIFILFTFFNPFMVLVYETLFNEKKYEKIIHYIGIFLANLLIIVFFYKANVSFLTLWMLGIFNSLQEIDVIKIMLLVFIAQFSTFYILKKFNISRIKSAVVLYIPSIPYWLSVGMISFGALLFLGWKP